MAINNHFKVIYLLIGMLMLHSCTLALDNDTTVGKSTGDDKTSAEIMKQLAVLFGGIGPVLNVPPHQLLKDEDMNNTTKMRWK